MKRVVAMRTVVCVLVLAALLIWQIVGRALRGRTTPAPDGAGPTINAIQRLSLLTTLRVDVSDALVTEVRGHTGGNKAALIVRGEIFIGADLSKAKFLSLDSERRHAVLQVPRPTLQMVRLDHQRTKLLGIFTNGLWAVTPGAQETDATTVNAAYREAEKTVAAVAKDTALVTQAQVRAEGLLGEFVKAMGWTVEIRWVE